MHDRKRRRDVIEIGGNEDQEGFFILEPIPVELGVGFSLSICHNDAGDEILQVKTYGKLNRKELLRQLRRKYPKARIEGLEAPSMIKVSEPRGKRKKRKSPKEP